MSTDTPAAMAAHASTGSRAQEHSSLRSTGRSQSHEAEVDQPEVSVWSVFRLLTFILMHLAGYGCNIFAIATFWAWKCYFYMSFSVTAFVLSAAVCGYAAWHCRPASRCISCLGLPLKERNFLLMLLLMIPYGFGQCIIIAMCIDETCPRGKPRDDSGSSRDLHPRRQKTDDKTRVHINRFHCKALTGMLEGFLSSTVLLYACQALDYPSGNPILIRQQYEGKVLALAGVVSVCSAGLGLVELDCCTSPDHIASRMQESLWYNFQHFLFRFFEIAARMSPIIAFAILAHDNAPLCYTPFFIALATSGASVIYYGGSEKLFIVKLLCVVACCFADIFLFIESPYKQRAARKLSRRLLQRHILEMIILVGLGFCVEDIGQKMMDLFNVHWKTCLLAAVANPIYFLLLCVIGHPVCTAERKLDICSACAKGDLEAARKLIRAPGITPIDVNICDVNGKTPLILAAKNGHAEICRLLIEDGARIGVRVFDDKIFNSMTIRRHKQRWTAVHFAAAKGDTKVLIPLLKSFQMERRQRQALQTGETEDGESFLIDVMDGSRDDTPTPLHVAVRYHKVEAAGLIAKKVPSWKSRLWKGRTPWNLAKNDDMRAALQNAATATPEDPEPTETANSLLDEAKPPLLSSSRVSSMIPSTSQEMKVEEDKEQEEWPQQRLQISKSKSSAPVLMAPGLCSFVAGNGGGVLGRVFLIDAAGPLQQIPEDGVYEEEGSMSYTDSVHGGSGLSSAPQIEDLQPVTKNFEVIGKWQEWKTVMLQAGTTDQLGQMFLTTPREARLGKGQYGYVWRAKDQKTGERYAVKNIEIETNTAKVALNECTAADHIKLKPHPCVVQFYGVHQFPSVRLYSIIMELCMGGTLTQRLIRKRQEAENEGGRPYKEPSQAKTWMGQIFLGLEHLHLKMDVLLRDLKPDNVVLNELGHVKLTDVGFARLGSVSDGTWTFGIPTGSPGYVAPEVLQNEKYNNKADLYSFGVLTWVVFAGGDPKVEEPIPPVSRMRNGRDYKALYNDWQLLHDSVKKNKPVKLADDVKTFILQTTARRQKDRLDHKQIRGKDFFASLDLPSQKAKKKTVEEWVDKLQHGSSPNGVTSTGNERP